MSQNYLNDIMNYFISILPFNITNYHIAGSLTHDPSYHITINSDSDFNTVKNDLITFLNTIGYKVQSYPHTTVVSTFHLNGKNLTMEELLLLDSTEILNFSFYISTNYIIPN